MTERVAVRIVVPDHPGSLARAAGTVAQMGGDIVGLAVLERGGGMAVDELLVELPHPGLGPALGRGLEDAPGATVEAVAVVPAGAEDRADRLTGAAMAILETSNATAALAALVGLAGELFSPLWAVLLDRRAGTFIHCAGPAPTAAAVEARARAGDGETAATGDGGDGDPMMVATLESTGLALGLGGKIPYRRRERRELELLARVADRACRPFRGDRIPRWWGE